MQRLPPESLSSAARALDVDHPDVAEFLRGLAAQGGLDRAVVERKAILRTIWRTRFLSVPRTAAGRLIAVEWAAVARGYAPDEVAAAYAGLAGFAPLAYRRIIDELDPLMD